MNPFDLREARRALKPSAQRAPKRKALIEMSEAEIKALPEREYVRRLTPKGRRAFLAFKKLKGML